MRIIGLICADKFSSIRQLDAARVLFFLAEYLLVIFLLSVDNSSFLNPLRPNDPYRGLTAPLASKVALYIFIQQI